MIFQVPTQSGAQIQQVFSTLQSWGFADALLPFLLIFTLIFAILQKVGLFKEDDKPNRKINAIIAFVIGALIVIPHITGSYISAGVIDPVTAILNFLPSAGILLVALLMLLLLTGFLGKIPNAVMYLALWGSVIILAIVILNSMFPIFDWLPKDSNTQALIVVLLVMGLIIWFITREPEGETKSFAEKLLESGGNWFNKP